MSKKGKGVKNAQEKQDLAERQAMKKGKNAAYFVSTARTPPKTYTKKAPVYTPPSDDEQRRLNREIDEDMHKRSWSPGCDMSLLLLRMGYPL